VRRVGARQARDRRLPSPPGAQLPVGARRAGPSIRRLPQGPADQGPEELHRKRSEFSHFLNSFVVVHKDSMYVYVFVGVSAHMRMNIYIYIVFLKKKEITIFHCVLRVVWIYVDVVKMI
jgi:hypothetical protein